MKRVTKALLAVMTVCVFCFATCSKEDDPAPKPEEQKPKFLGVWTFQYDVYHENSSVLGESTDTTAYDAGSILAINEDSTFTSTRIVNGDTAIHTGTWKLEDGNTFVTVPVVLGYEKFVIKMQTDSVLVLYGQFTKEFYTGETTIYFERK